MSTAIVWFRQDLRIQDNTALIESLKYHTNIIPVFIMDTTILQSSPASDRRIGFLIDVAKQLNHDLINIGSHLIVLYGDPVDIIPEVSAHRGITCVYTNTSYGRGATSRDQIIKTRCETIGVSVISCLDYLLVSPESVPYRKVFTPFYKLRKTIPKPLIGITPSHIITPSVIIPTHIRHLSLDALQPQDIGGGDNIYRPIKSYHDRLDSFGFSTYDETRNIPSVDGSSKMSPYLRFGLISIRILYQKAIDTNSIVYMSELAWREFWHHIAHYAPDTLSIEFQEKRRNLTRRHDQHHIDAWRDGMTGYPIVDAGMRQLREMNRMHNRVRMIVASFLTKDLMIDRRIGEQHFHDWLIDYDRNVNIGNRQRSASVGADPKPLRIFSPILQAQRFDPDTSYILQRCPELQGIPAVKICDPIKYDLYTLSGGLYPRPIVDHATWSKRAKMMYMKQPELRS